jgi:hypothetical protein
MSCRLVAGADAGARADAEDRYLEALNRCFPAWGGREMFDWCFKRESAGLRPDLMTLHAGGGAVAGTANTYGRIRLPLCLTLVAGIMTGSWTLPESRGLGAFTRLIGESRDLAASRGAGLLLAFVTRTNGSTGRLRDAGAALFPTWYCRTPEEWRQEAGSHASDAANEIDGMNGGRGTPPVRFVYDDEEWRDQFILRPDGIMREQNDSPDRSDRPARPGWHALIERTPQFDRVLSLTDSPSDSRGAPEDVAWPDAIPALATRAAAANRRLFCFTSMPHRAAQLRERGFEIIDGYLTALIANEAVLRAALEAVPPRTPQAQETPRTLASQALTSQALTSQTLADPASPWFLGEWFVNNGDRM